MTDILQNISPLLEILCAFFFLITFSSFRKIMLQIIMYDEWRKSLIDDKVDSYKNLSESMNSFQLVTQHVEEIAEDVRASLNNLNEAYRNYVLKVEAIDLGETLCFDRISFMCAFYCLLLLIFAGVPPNYLDEVSFSNTVIVFSLFFLSFLCILGILDIWNIRSKKKWLQVFLVQMSHLRALLIFGVILILSFLEYFLRLFQTYVLRGFSNDLISFVIILIPVFIILIYAFSYLIRYRSFRIKIRPINSGFEQQIATSNQVYENSIKVQTLLVKISRTS